MSKSYKKSKNVSKHSMRRGKQRLGASKTTTKKLAARAFGDGISLSWVHGDLLEVMKRFHGCNIRYYANAIYLFGSNGKLITVMNIDPEYEKNLLDYVDYPTFVWYKTNRFKFKSDQSSLAIQIKEAHDKLLEDINTTVLEDTDIEAKSIKVSNREGTVYVSGTFVEEIAKELDDLVFEKYNMHLCIIPKIEVHNKPTNPRTIVKWFNRKSGVLVKALYISKKNIIITIREDSKNKYIPEEIIEEFSKFYDLNVTIVKRAESIYYLDKRNDIEYDKYIRCYHVKEWFLIHGFDIEVVNLTKENVVITHKINDNVFFMPDFMYKVVEDKYHKPLIYMSRSQAHDYLKELNYMKVLDNGTTD